MLARPSPLVREVIGCAIEVHRTLGPGLLESSYEACLVYEFSQRGVRFERQVPVPIAYKDVKLHCGYRVDLVIEDQLLLELKSVTEVTNIHRAQLMTYLKLLDLKQGILMNFNVTKLVDGVYNVLR
jgi:GxxExxY protein